ncbi:MAG: type ISP restriction/modification enzyme [Thermus sp.]
MVRQALEAYLRDYREVFHDPTPPPGFSPEDQLKFTVRRLFQNLGLFAYSEVSRHNIGRPDLGIFQGNLLVGYVELKAPGKDLEPARFTGHDKAQWERFKALPNLIYSNGLIFRLYRQGQLLCEVDLTPGLKRLGDREVQAFEDLLLQFKAWGLEAPKDPKGLADLLAPIARYLRQEALEALQAPLPQGEYLKKLYREWQGTFLPGADEKVFADAFAQLLTYAFLLARLEWDEARGPFALENILAYLYERHSLLMEALFLANYPAVIDEVYGGYQLLRRALKAVDPSALAQKGVEPWLYFYEDFLAAYDPDLRRDLGVYYTPKEVVEAMVHLGDSLLRTRMGREEGFGQEDVTVLDPALGTGTFLLAALKKALDNAEALYGRGYRGSKATQVAQRLFGFELMLGPYAVAQFRLSRAVREEGGELPEGGLKVFLTDTLEDPYGGTVLEQLGMVYRRLAEEHERASRVKREEPILVVLGNPPYDRVQGESEEERRKKAGWLLRPRDPNNPQSPPLMEDFLKPLGSLNLGLHAKNLYNLYVYFWRWALWKAFEQDPKRPGIVAFITASSYLTGPGFAGMRAHMRNLLEELYILDLGGEGRGAVREENVFNIQTPVAIAIAVRYGEKGKNPARVFYHKVPGLTRKEKLDYLAGLQNLGDIPFQEVRGNLTDPFLPGPSGKYATWPKLTDLFPWQHSGVEFKRTWPIGPTRKTLEARWQALLLAQDRKEVFREERDRRVDQAYPAIFGQGRLPPISELNPRKRPEAICRYGYRAFDRAWAIVDGRVCSRPRPPLWQTAGEKQVFLASLLTSPLGKGPALLASAHVPDRHFFRGSYGGKDIIPLYRDRKGQVPNLVHGLLGVLEQTYGFPVSAEDFLAYVYALLAHPGFTKTFQEEVQRPPLRVPITRNGDLFRRGVALGRRLLCCHTFGERFPEACRLRGKAQWEKAPSRYPQHSAYDPKSQTLQVGDGEVAPVSPEVWAYEVSGFQPLKAWLRYRTRGAGRKESPLDGILPGTWGPDLARELLEVVWALECSLGLQPEGEALLAEVLEGPLFSAEELPTPTEEERRPPETEGTPPHEEAVQARLL